MNYLKDTFLYKIEMLYCDRIDISEGIDVNNTSESKEWNICYYWYFSNKGFKFQTNVCNGHHDIEMMSMYLSHIAIFNIKDSDYCCIVSGLAKVWP